MPISCMGDEDMKLNIGLIAHELPVSPLFICGNPNHKLVLCDVRYLVSDEEKYAEDILYFAEWERLNAMEGPMPAFVFCVGGNDDANKWMEHKEMTGIIVENGDLIMLFTALQNIFMHFNGLEINLLTALHNKVSTREILNHCAEFFKSHAILYDEERNVIDYSERYMPDADDTFWKETLQTGRRSEKMLKAALKNNILESTRTDYSDFVDFGPGLPKILTYSFFENDKRLATLAITETSTPLSVMQLKLMDYISGLLSPSLFHIYSPQNGYLESLRSILAAILDKEDVDQIVINKCLSQAGWNIDDNYLLILIHISETVKNADILTRYRHIYERIFPECIAIKYINGIVLIIHNDTGAIIDECLPKLEKQLCAHNAVCGLSFPFKGILQINSQVAYADIAMQSGDKNKRIRMLNEILADHIVNRIASVIPLLPLCHRNAIQIYDYDQLNGTELLLSLETYLRLNKSLKAAAEELFIHRSTMTYRLGCIEKIVNMDLDDSKQRLHILLSCIVLRVLGGQK